MRRQAILAAAGLTCALSIGSAAEVAHFEVKTTRDLVALCSVPMSDPHFDAAMGYCLGYIDAAHDYHAAVARGELLTPITCPHPDVTRGHVADALVEWSRDSEHLLDTERPIHGLMRAMSTTWPCE